jgi:hypothetical protein
VRREHRRRHHRLVRPVTVSDAVRLELTRRRRQRLLGEILDQFEASSGPADEKLVEKHIELLG